MVDYRGVCVITGGWSFEVSGESVIGKVRVDMRNS